MSPAQPVGLPAPTDGLIRSESVQAGAGKPFSLYVHVPYCSVRCGYCDFNTYAQDDFGDGVNLNTFADEAIAELDFAHSVLQNSGAEITPLQSVFFGGGTPTRIPSTDLVRILQHAVSLFGLSSHAEVTTEANPDSVDEEDIQILADGGFTRISFGMQSAVPRVLKILDRTHTPDNVPKVVRWAQQAGLQASVDLIYGAPGETLSEWEQSLRAAVSYHPDHISAYSLIVEEGTKMWARIRRGELYMPDDDAMADMYLLADRILGESGYQWYEVSNFSTDISTRSTHNLAYWHNVNWWGIGPGAHSHWGGTRWWNVKHPLAYSQRIRQQISPAQAREVLTPDQQHFEDVMLRLRIREGMTLRELQGQNQMSEDLLHQKIQWLEKQGLIEAVEPLNPRVVLTLKGRLLGDAVTRELLPE